MTTFPLRTLEARLQKVVTVTSDEIERLEEGCVGLYVFRDEDGEKSSWSPRPYTYHFHTVETVAEADQIRFLCPACFEKNGGPKGTHGVHVSFAGRDMPEDSGSRDSSGKPSRWTVTSGNTIDDLCLSPSILLGAGQPPERGCHWHGFVGMSGIPTGHAG